MTSRRTKLAI